MIKYPSYFSIDGTIYCLVEETLSNFDLNSTSLVKIFNLLWRRNLTSSELSYLKEKYNYDKFKFKPMVFKAFDIELLIKLYESILY